MRILKFLFIIAVIGFGIYWWKGHSELDEKSPNGFVSVMMPKDAEANTVLIFAPLNCPSEEAQKAYALSDELNRLNIPNKISASYSVDPENATEEEQLKIKQSFKVLDGKDPVVFVNGMGKNNPSADEIAAEYERTNNNT
jgi:hypothetical protein